MDDHYATRFGQWITERAARAGHSDPAGFAALWAPDNRHNGLDERSADVLASLIGATCAEVRAAHKADISEWVREQKLYDHPDIAGIDADLERAARRI